MGHPETTRGWGVSKKATAFQKREEKNENRPDQQMISRLQKQSREYAFENMPYSYINQEHFQEISTSPFIRRLRDKHGIRNNLSKIYWSMAEKKSLPRSRKLGVRSTRNIIFLFLYVLSTEDHRHRDPLPGELWTVPYTRGEGKIKQPPPSS